MVGGGGGGEGELWRSTDMLLTVSKSISTHGNVPERFFDSRMFLSAIDQVTYFNTKRLENLHRRKKRLLILSRGVFVSEVWNCVSRHYGGM